jgi:cytoskeletal protein RodZ
MAVFGDTLRQARAHKGVSLREAEQKTRINRHHLLALEEERFHELPALIYQRGIVKNYGTYLDLDPNKLLTMFEDARGIDPEELEARIPVQTPIGVPQHFSPNFAIIAFFVVMSAVVFAWMYSVYFAPPGATSTPTEVIPTVTQLPVTSDSMFAPSPIIIPNTPTPSVTATAADASPTAKPTKQATATATRKAENSGNSNAIVSTNGNSGNASAADANTGNVDASNGNAADANAADANASDANASDANSANTSDASATQTPADGQISLDFVATTDLSSLTVVVDGNNVFDSSLANGDATGYLTGTNFEIHVSDPNGLTIYKDGSSFQMGLSTFSLP